MHRESKPTVSILTASELTKHRAELSALMHACVNAGASVGYVLPYCAEDALAFWRDQVGPGVLAGTRLLLVARQHERIVGSVQLDFDTPPNQPHRAEVRKLLVEPAARRQGIARLLMIELEHRAAELGLTLLTLDTRTGDSAEPLYTSLGYTVVGIIPGYCRDTANASRIDSTTIMYKQL